MKSAKREHVGDLDVHQRLVEACYLLYVKAETSHGQNALSAAKRALVAASHALTRAMAVHAEQRKGQDYPQL